MFDPSIYVTRRNRLRTQVGSGLVLFLGNEESPMNYADNTYRFRQDSTFLYFLGLDAAGLAAVVDLDESTDTIYGNDLTVEDFVWTGPQPSLREMAAKVGVERTETLPRLAELLARARTQGRRIHFLPPYRPENKLKLQEWLGVRPDRAGSEASVELIKAVVAQRSVKSPEEIAEIEKAVDVTVDMHLTGMRMARPGVAEAEIAAAVHRHGPR